jgi:hypothetical protein
MMMDKIEDEEIKKLSAVERLEELLNAKDEELRELRRQIRAQEDDDEKRVWNWSRHHIFTEKDDVALPVPRLELRWENQDEHGYNRICWYYLVFRHLLGNIVKVPLSYTQVNGGGKSPFYSADQHYSGEDYIDTPLRDGAHIVNDARQLRLPAFVIWEDKVQEIIPEGKEGRRKALSKWCNEEEKYLERL